MAEEDKGEESDPKTETPKEDPKADTKDRTYDAAEFQAEVDRRVTGALTKAQEQADLDKKQAVDAERKALEAKQLEEQGKYRELHESSRAELDAIKARLEIREQNDAIRSALKKADLGTFESVLLDPKTKPEDYVTAAKSLQDTIDKQVEAEIAKRLGTGNKPTGANAAATEAEGFQYPEMDGLAS